jgi:hypothetical protein
VSSCWRWRSGWIPAWEISTAVSYREPTTHPGGVRSVVVNGYAVAIVTIEGAPPMLIGSLLAATGLLSGVPIAVWLTVAVLAVVGGVRITV